MRGKVFALMNISIMDRSSISTNIGTFITHANLDTSKKVAITGSNLKLNVYEYVRVLSTFVKLRATLEWKLEDRTQVACTRSNKLVRFEDIHYWLVDTD